MRLVRSLQPNQVVSERTIDHMRASTRWFVAEREDAIVVRRGPGGNLPESLSTDAGVRHRMESATERGRMQGWKVEREGVVVGWGSGALDWVSTTETDAFASLQMHSEHRRQGIGRELWSRVDAHLAELWVRETFGNPDFDADLSTVVTVDGMVVGTSLLYADHTTGRALNGGTGVLREHRGRGLGLLLKTRGLAAAAAAGITRVCTTNDETNVPMLAINRRLGYQPFATSCSWRRG